MSWFVLYTKPRNEKKTAARLAEQGVKVYCPVHEVLKQWSDRKKKILEPVFRSYLFVRLEDYQKEQVAVLSTPGAVRFLWWQGKPGMVRDVEIEAIRNFLNDYKGANIGSVIAAGQNVTISEGVLKDQSGVVVQIKGNKAILQLKSLGWNVTAELPLQSLTKI